MDVDLCLYRRTADTPKEFWMTEATSEPIVYVLPTSVSRNIFEAPPCWVPSASFVETTSHNTYLGCHLRHFLFFSVCCLLWCHWLTSGPSVQFEASISAAVSEWKKGWCLIDGLVFYVLAVHFSSGSLITCSSMCMAGILSLGVYMF